MSFNSDLNKRVQEVAFSSKIKTLTNPSATFNNSNVSQAFSKTPRHCIIFKVNIWKVSNNVSNKVNKTIGLLCKPQNLL